jgi:trans-2,3-dihydro-3-hydroxyanthranilate isomerase
MTHPHYDFYTADAFTDQPYHGAQIAVLPHAEGLSDDQMQRIAGEFNLSETVFVFSVEDDPNARRLRIFSPHREIDFAGHPIVATGHVLATIGDVSLDQVHNRLEFRQNAGPITVHVTRHEGRPLMIQFELSARPRTDRFVPTTGEIATILGISPDDVGAAQYDPLLVASDQPYLVVPLRSYEAVRRAVFSYRHWNSSSAPSMMAREMLLFSLQTAHTGADFHGRLVGPDVGINDDPPIGSAIPAFASYLCAHDHVREGTYSFTAERGTPQSRLSLLHVEMDHKNQEELSVRVGGPAVMISQGKLIAPSD